MTATLLQVDPVNPEPEKIALAAAEIRGGRLVAFPTETVYGLGANALDETAVSRIFVAKARPSEDPLIVHICKLEDLAVITGSIPELVSVLAEAFWPGPLTLILPKSRLIPDNVSAGLNNVAVRMPSHHVALALLESAGVPIAAPSANRFGHTSPTSAAHVLQDLGEYIDLILDGGETSVGVESTVLDLTQTPPVILRPGGLTREELERLVGPVGWQEKSGPGPQASPGLLDSHYAPRARLTLFTGESPAMLENMVMLATRYLEKGKRVGMLLADDDEVESRMPGMTVIRLGPGNDLPQIARNLYAGLHKLDDLGVDVILAHSFARQGLGLAINDRLTRASSQVVPSNADLPE
jgi:L-threonylcarbamoyladenylate synthase